MKKVYITRGLPGCGKTTWIDQQPGPKLICSADHIHLVDGVYKYDPLKVSEGHAQCLLKYVDALPHFPFDIYVDNTNTRVSELAPYMALAIAYKVPCEIVYIPCSVETSLKRNTHGVPASTILEMNRCLTTESLPPYWPIRIIV